MSEETLKDGSSFARRANASPIFSWSAFVFGSTATSITGSGNSILSRTIWLSVPHNVSPVVVSFNPTRATISPARASLISSLELECISNILPILSFLFFTVLTRVWPVSKTPEYILANVKFPTNGSFITLNARRDKGSVSEDSLFISSSVSG